jgi:23S rRNA pseudoU1915 N3-methylase RlmH
LKINKQLVVAGALAAVSLAGITGLGVASAETNGSSSLIDKLATKFNLKKEDVQAVFDEEKSARQAERQEEFSERLQDKVDSGDITAEQKSLIENKIKELQTVREAERTELEKWATDNKIDVKYLMGGHHGGDDRLQDAVDDGDITAEQKSLIENKREELEDKREAARDTLEKWAEDNDIELRDIGGLGGHGGGRGGPRGRH